MHIDVLGVCLQKVHPKMNRIEDPDENQLKADVASSKYFYFYFTYLCLLSFLLAKDTTAETSTCK